MGHRRGKHSTDFWRERCHLHGRFGSGESAEWQCDHQWGGASGHTYAHTDSVQYPDSNQYPDDHAATDIHSDADEHTVGYAYGYDHVSTNPNVDSNQYTDGHSHGHEHGYSVSDTAEHGRGLPAKRMGA